MTDTLLLGQTLKDESIICRPLLPRAGSPRDINVPRAGSPRDIKVPEAGSPRDIKVPRAGSP